MFALVCGMSSVRWKTPFQVDVPSTVSFRPLDSAVAAGFLYDASTLRYCEVGCAPWMYHWYSPTWLPQLHLSKSAEGYW
jgi:hypothetical protein